MWFGGVCGLEVCVVWRCVILGMCGLGVLQIGQMRQSFNIFVFIIIMVINIYCFFDTVVIFEYFQEKQCFFF